LSFTSVVNHTSIDIDVLTNWTPELLTTALSRLTDHQRELIDFHLNCKDAKGDSVEPTMYFVRKRFRDTLYDGPIVKGDSKHHCRYPTIDAYNAAVSEAFAVVRDYFQSQHGLTSADDLEFTDKRATATDGCGLAKRPLKKSVDK
jgi:hypothetical protein